MAPKPMISVQDLVTAVHAHRAHGPGPTLRQLADQFGTSTQAVRTAIRHAEHAGQLHRIPGIPRGLFVPEGGDEV